MFLKIPSKRLDELPSLVKELTGASASIEGEYLKFDAEHILQKGYNFVSTPSFKKNVNFSQLKAELAVIERYETPEIGPFVDKVSATSGLHLLSEEYYLKYDIFSRNWDVFINDNLERLYNNRKKLYGGKVNSCILTVEISKIAAFQTLARLGLLGELGKSIEEIERQDHNFSSAFLSPFDFMAFLQSIFSYNPLIMLDVSYKDNVVIILYGEGVAVLSYPESSSLFDINNNFSTSIAPEAGGVEKTVPIFYRQNSYSSIKQKIVFIISCLRNFTQQLFDLKLYAENEIVRPFYWWQYAYSIKLILADFSELCATNNTYLRVSLSIRIIDKVCGCLEYLSDKNMNESNWFTLIMSSKGKEAIRSVIMGDIKGSMFRELSELFDEEIGSVWNIIHEFENWNGNFEFDKSLKLRIIRNLSHGAFLKRTDLLRDIIKNDEPRVPLEIVKIAWYLIIAFMIDGRRLSQEMRSI